MDPKVTYTGRAVYTLAAAPHANISSLHVQ